ncbi:MAG: SOS response-associated peptidase family protein [Fimbriimonadaceae bacterium]
MLTTEPNSLMAPIHHRMPIIVDQSNYDSWLNGGELVSVGPERMQAWEIGPAWGKTTNQDPAILDPSSVPRMPLLL